MFAIKKEYLPNYTYEDSVDFELADCSFTFDFAKIW